MSEHPSQRVELRVKRPTGTLVRRTPTLDAAQAVEAIADYGQTLRHAVQEGEWWRLPLGYVHKDDVIALGAAKNIALNATRVPPDAYEPLSQRDPRWARIVLGNSSLPQINLNDFGCLLLCYTMLVNVVLSPRLDPSQLNYIRKMNGGFSAPGPWGGMAATFDVGKETNNRIKIAWISERNQVNGISGESLRRVKDHLSIGMPAILEVDFYPDDGAVREVRRDPGLQMHFVLATHLEPGGNINIIDPYDAGRKTLSPRFGGNNAFAIKRAALYDIDNFAQSVPVPGAPGGDPNVDLPQPVPALGINALWNGRVALDAFARGCRWFTTINNIDIARELNKRGAMVAVRWVWGKTVPTVDEYMKRMGDLIPGAVYLGLNEADSINYTPPNIRKRAEFDLAVARAIRKNSGGKSLYAAGSLSMNEPSFDDPATCKAIRENYADSYNAGLILFDMHCYVPSIKGEFGLLGARGNPGFARRWENLFTRCGFDPTWRGIIMSETGLDNGAGFLRNRVSNPEFSTFCEDWANVQRAPLMINNRRDEAVRLGRATPSPWEGKWPSPVLGGTLFQLSPPEATEWRDHNLYLYLGELQQVWKKQNNLPEGQLPIYPKDLTPEANKRMEEQAHG